MEGKNNNAKQPLATTHWNNIVPCPCRGRNEEEEEKREAEEEKEEERERDETIMLR